MVIHDIDGKKLLDVILTESAEHEQELSKSDFVKLSWESDVKITIPAGSYIIPFEDGLKYRLLNSYTPSETDKGFKYDISFHHPLMWLSRVPFLYVENDLKQQEWSFEGLTVSALEYVCKAINEAFGITDDTQKFTYTLCGTVDGSVNFSVSSNDILSVLSSIAQACKDNNCEWHLSWEHRALYFGQIAINLGEEVPVLKVHDNIQTASVNESKEDYYNCFYPQGSTKNMSRKAQVGTGNVATLARLGLDTTKYPDGCIYVGTDGKVITKERFDASNAIKQTLALSFDDIFPHLDLYAYNIRKRTRWLKNDTTGEYEKNPDGTNKIYTVWYMRLAYCTTTKDTTKPLVNTTTDKDERGNTVTHYWYDYDLDPKKQILQGYTLKGTFKVNTHTTNSKYDALTQSLVGQPSGQDGFELDFHEEDSHYIPASETTGDSGVSVLKGDYEIVMYQSGDTIIPTNEEDGFIPHGKALPDLTCNIVVLFNIVMGEYETKLAQEELAARTIKEINRRAQDNNNYTAHSNAVEFARKNPNLYIGQKVTYDDGFGYQLSTRVIKLVTKLDYPIIQEITVGNQAIKGTISQLKEDVNNILSGNFSGGGLNASQIGDLLKNYTAAHLLRKDTPDTAQRLITFLEGIALGSEDGKYYLDADGFARLFRVVASSVTSSRYTAGDEGLGYSLYESEDGTGTLEVDNLKVRRQMSIAELEVRKKTYTSGNLSLGKAGNTIFAVKSFRQDGTPIADMVFAVGGAAIAVQDGSVTVLGKVSENETPSWYRCYFLRTDGERTVDNCWKAGDQAKCQTSNLTEGTTHNAANRYYWRLVVGKGTETLEDGREYHYVDLSNEESPVVEMPMIIKGEALAFYGKEDDMPDWDGITARYNLVPKAGDVYLYAHEDGAGTQPEVITYTTDTEYTVLVPEQDDIYRTADGRYYSADLDYNGDLWIETTAAAQVLQGYDPSADNDAPMTGDDIAQEGNQVDKGRQGLLVIDADDGISKYRGIDGFTYEGKRRQHIGDTVELEVNRLTIVSEAPDGTPEEHRVPCYMGAWTARPYPYYSQVDCDGSIWLCTRPAGATVADRPQDGSAVWHKQVGRGEKGDKGEQGNAVSSYTFFRYSDDGGQTFTAAKPWAETGEYGNGRNLYIGKRACEFNGIPNQYSFALPEGVVNAVSGQKVTLSAYVEGENLNDPSVSHYMVDLYFKFADGTGVWSNFNKNAQFKNADTIPGMRYSRTIDLSGHVLTEISHTNISLSKREGEPLASGVRLVIKDIKIEIGDTATEYTPAPEDQQFGLTTGAWLGVAAWDRPYPPMEASAYSWSEVKGTDGQSAEIYRLRAGTEKAQVDGSGNLTVNLSYQIEHVRGATTKMEDASASGMKVRYRGDTGTPADTVMGYGDTPSASYVLEDYTHVPHPDYIIVELLNKDGNVLDRRTVPVTFSAVAALDINGQVGEISARVQGMAGGGRNLLKGTAFEREHPDWFELRGGAPIWPSVKHGGHNSVDCSLTGMTGDMYKGAYFRAEVEPGKKYTASVWSHGDPASFDKDAVIEVSYAADTQGGRTILATESIRPSELRVWQRFHKTFTVPQGVYEIEVNFFNIRNGGMQIAEPMLTSGNMLVDWQPAPEDAEAFLTELKMSITNLSLSITDLKTGLEAVGIHLFSTERPNIRFVGNSVAYYDTTGKMFMSQGVGPGGEVYFIIYDKDGVTPLYNLGRMGMQQIIGHATPYSMEESNRLGPIPPGTVLTAVELWSDLQTTQYGTLRHTSWLYTEAYTLDGQGGRLYQYGGVYNGMYDSPAVDGDNKPTGNRLPEDGQGAYIGVWDTSDPSGHLHSTAIVYNYPNEEGKAAERLKVSLLKDYYGAGQDRYLLSLNGGDYTEQMTVPLIAIRP